MTLCAFIKPGGQRCGATAMKGYDVCYGHRPDLAEERRKAASKGGKRGGRGRPGQDLAQIKQRLSDLADDVLAGRADRGNAAVAAQVLNVYLRVAKLELDIREQTELIERLEELEARIA